VEPAAGTRVGPYILMERLGSGGMGDVYLGQDTRLNRQVALKCLHAAETADDQQHARIIHEARAAAQINHGNVATIHDVIDQGSRAYIVMEYVDGESLAARLRRGRVPLREVLSIGRQLLSALGAAHAVGVVHRDLKPANIQLTRAGVVKVLDFGIARASRPALGSATAATHTAKSETDIHVRRAGTPAYMAPEQWVDASPDQRADLYSLGVVLFELATGRRPYESFDPLELVRMPDSLAPRADEIDPAVPQSLADALATALKCDPKHRYQSDREFDAALADVQSELEARRRPTRREWLALAGLGIAGAAGLIVWRRSGPPPVAGPRPIRSIAVLPFVNLSGDPGQEYFVDGMTDGLINALGRISAVSVTARTSVMVFKGSKKSIAEIADDLDVDAIVEGSALLTSKASEVVRVTINVIDPVTQRQLWSTALERDVKSVLTIPAELAQSIATRIRVTVTEEERTRIETAAQTVDPETFKLYLLGRREWTGRTVPELQRARTYFDQAVARSSDYAPAYAGLADVYVLLAGEFAVLSRADGAELAISNASRALALDSGLAEAYTSLAFANFFLQWDFAAAGQQFKKALELNPSYATAHHWYGNYLSDIGKEDDALREIRRALALDPLSPIISRDVAWPLFFSRRYDEAIAHLDVTLKTFPGYQPAERLRARALALRGEHPAGARPRCELAWAYALAGRRADALAELRSASTLKSPVYPYDVALVHAALNDADQAIAALERAFVERDSTMVNLRHDPRFDSLRTDGRYQELVAKMRFPQL
jgi:serine/threonine protein kinase/tetratricopeptide (TPR) repeat protein